MNTWNIITDNKTTNHSCDFLSRNNDELKLAIEACAGKAISLLKENIQDDSLYLMFEWSPGDSVLTVVLTDATKQQDACQKVVGVFSELNQTLTQLTPSARAEQTQTTTELIQFWLYDYLTTCTEFFKYSLVAIFHSSSRSESQLL
jgi:hypothetical protein